MTKTRSQTAAAAQAQLPVTRGRQSAPKIQKKAQPASLAQSEQSKQNLSVSQSSIRITKQSVNQLNDSQGFVNGGSSAQKLVANGGTTSVSTARGGAKSKMTKAQEKAAKEKIDAAKKEFQYSDLINLGIVKKFDATLVADQTGNSIGDCHLPRATLNQIIKESLPTDVRAQKETMDLICFIANSFVDLLSDTSNNVCYHQKKKNIIPEHMIRALQEFHLDDFLPFLLTDDQNQSLQEILKVEKKKPNGFHTTVKQLQNSGDSQESKERMVNQMLKRLSDQHINLEKKKKKKNSNKFAWMQGMTAEQIEEEQRKLFENMGNTDSEEQANDGLNANQDETSNESPSNPQHQYINGNSSMEIYTPNVSGQQQNGMAMQGQANATVSTQDQAQYWEQYKQQWISHNLPVLNEDYKNWVTQNVEYAKRVQSSNEAQPDVDPSTLFTNEVDFMFQYPAQYFYEQQYQQFINTQYYSDQQQPVQQEHQANDQQNQQQQISEEVQQQQPVQNCAVVGVQSEQAGPESGNMGGGQIEEDIQGVVPAPLSSHKDEVQKQPSQDPAGGDGDEIDFDDME